MGEAGQFAARLSPSDVNLGPRGGFHILKTATNVYSFHISLTDVESFMYFLAQRTGAPDFELGERNLPWRALSYFSLIFLCCFYVKCMFMLKMK